MSVNDRGGVMTTAQKLEAEAPDTGGNDLTTEAGTADPARLIALHRQSVEAFCKARGLSIVPVSVGEAAARELAFRRRTHKDDSKGLVAVFAILLMGILPVFVVGTGPDRPGLPFWIAYGA